MGFQKLKHGLFITRQNFPQFVETFNDLVDFCNSLRGDADAPNDSGIIRLDRRVRGRPVIRADTSRMTRGDSKATEDVGCYAVSTNGNGEPCFANRYFTCGGRIYEGPDGTPRAGFAALSIPCQGDDDPAGATIEFYSTFSELKAAGADYTKYTIPLYKFDEDDDGNVTVAIDFRNMPSAAMGEAGL